jgi:hypothetical protein
VCGNNSPILDPKEALTPDPDPAGLYFRAESMGGNVYGFLSRLESVEVAGPWWNPTKWKINRVWKEVGRITFFEWSSPVSWSDNQLNCNPASLSSGSSPSGELTPGRYIISTTAVHLHDADQPAGWYLSAWRGHNADRSGVSSWVGVHRDSHWKMIWNVQKSSKTGTWIITTTSPSATPMPAGWGLSSWQAHGAVRSSLSSRVAAHEGDFWRMDWEIKPSTRTQGAWTIKTKGGPAQGHQPDGWGLCAWNKHGAYRDSTSSWVYTHEGDHWLMDWKFEKV